MENFDQFEQQALNEGRVDFDGVFQYQCVDLILQGVYLMYGIRGEYGNAIDYWNRPTPVLLTKFDKIKTTDIHKSDIVILQVANPLGHVVWATGNQNGTQFEAIEQNGGAGSGTGSGSDAIRRRYISKAAVLGVLRPKNPAVPAEPAQSPVPSSPEGTYNVVRDISGYITANNAANRNNPASTVHPGNYSIFNQANGMINVTSKTGQPGSWINPADNSAPTASQPAPASYDGNTIVVQPGWGLSNAADAAGYPDAGTPIRWAAIAALNGSDDWQTFNAALKPGQRINVGSPQAAPAPAAPAAPNTAIVVGSTVTPTRAVDYNGTSLDPKVLSRQYPVIEVAGDRAVLGAGLMTAFHTGDLQLINAPAPAEPAKPPITYSRLDQPLPLVTKLNPTHVWQLDFPTYPDAKASYDLPADAPFVAYGKAQRGDLDQPVYFMTQDDFGSADTTSTPNNNRGVNTIDLTSAPVVPPASDNTPKVSAVQTEQAAPADDAGEKVDVKILPPNLDTKFGFTEFPTPRNYTAVRLDAHVKELQNLTNADGSLVHLDQQLVPSQPVVVGGMLSYEGKSYYRTQKSIANNLYYAIPTSDLTLEDDLTEEELQALMKDSEEFLAALGRDAKNAVQTGAKVGSLFDRIFHRNKK